MTQALAGTAIIILVAFVATLIVAGALSDNAVTHDDRRGVRIVLVVAGVLAATAAGFGIAAVWVNA